ncbi:radical SAM protein [Sulfurospirillum diekertiae]|uniref:Radical SAM protein n=1 Tax=Sulfurospirillum diekertiae TaxID=1854492 RepID=A0A6G9VTM9_9BACT|nr:radical SAM protein [Sulfurospirillum diekertiae]QIR76353.1 radical SAM protein [Sulfurospirillum diekertiae]QIR78983.1 radical SAM protein [Sulfurospirillum diekertiae]
MSQIIFGPITSRRFGQSLGIDLSPSIKQCNFDCLYCELKGAKTVDKAKDAPSFLEVLDALKTALSKHQNLDVITLTANGEPTLYPELDALVSAILKIENRPKLLILSNGSTIYDEAIQTTLSKIDIVKLSLDCVSPKCFKKLDRAHKGIEIEQIIEGMQQFRARYQGTLVIEILVVEGLNDTEEEFRALNAVLHDINPDRIDVSTIDRPPAYEVKGVSIERLVELSNLLEDLHVNIAYKKNYISQKRYFSEEEIYELLKRRPQSFEDIALCFDEQSLQNLNYLVEKNALHVKNIAGVNFYKVT